MPLFSLQSNQYSFNFNAFHYRQAQYLTKQWLFKHLCNLCIVCLSLFTLISFSGVEWIQLYENTNPALKVRFHKIKINQPTRCNLVSEFIIPQFIKSSTCFERYVAHHQEPKLYLQPLVYIRMRWQPVVKSKWELSSHSDLITGGHRMRM